MTGVVKGTESRLISGATVAVKGTAVAATTKEDGKFSINADIGDVLIVSHIGFKPKEVRIDEQLHIEVKLVEALAFLEEVVVTGYTSQKVKAITGSVAMVKMKDLLAVPAGQTEQLLQGRFAGLNVITSGLPGSPSNVRLHGIGNFGDVTPLYIIDGVQGNINNLNPNDIESVQLLKDAGAYAVYGVRGANGVLVVTTKSGKNGKTKVSYDSYFGVVIPPSNGPELLNSQEMADLTWLAYKNSGIKPSHSLYGNGSKPVLPDFFLPGLSPVGLSANDPQANPDSFNIDFNQGKIHQIVPSNKKGTNWLNEAYDPAFKQSHSLSVSGANEKNKYLFSLGYYDENGTLLNTWFKRFNTRVNTEYNVANSVRIGENLQWVYRDFNGIPKYPSAIDNAMFYSITAHPIAPVTDLNGGWGHYLTPNFDANPVAMRTVAKDNISKSWEVFGNVFAEADFLNYFIFRSNFGGSFLNYFSNQFDYYSYHENSLSLPDNYLYESSGYRRSWTWTNSLAYSQLLGESHQVNVFVATEAIDNYNRDSKSANIGLLTNDPNFRSIGNGVPYPVADYRAAGTSSLQAFISQLDYGFRERYFFRATFRRDGASFFGPQNRYGWFPSFSAAWRLTEEKFMQNADWLNEFKLRASWGKSGYYGNTDPFNQFTLYGASPADSHYDISGTNNSTIPGIRAVQTGDSSTGWQKDIVTNIGIESVFWNGKLGVTIDYYWKTANGLLLEVALPAVVGGARPPNVNIGTIRNRGLDLLLTSKGRWAKEWSWDLAVTFSLYDNTIVKLNGLNFFPPVEANIQGKQYVRNQVGYPVSSFYGYKVTGIFRNAEEVDKAPAQDDKAPGRFRYADINKDGKIDAGDRTFIGNANPDFTLGLNTVIGFRNFDFSAFFFGSIGNEVINIPREQTDFFLPGHVAKSKALLYDSWTPQNPDATLPKAEWSNNSSNAAVVNSFLVEDGSYFRCKSVIIGYTFPKTLLQKNKIDRLRLYLQVANLFTITKYSGLDPELSGTSAAFGIDVGNFPNNQKQFLFGINFGF